MIFYPFYKTSQDKYEIRKTSDYGWRVLNGVQDFHKGVDYSPKIKTETIEIVASQYGELKTGKDSNGGLYSLIKGIDGKGYLTVHHSSFIKTSGFVIAGEPIAYIGKSGNATGIHIHFEVRDNYNDTNSHINPEILDLTYYDHQMINFAQVLAWNDAIGTKKLTDKKVEVKGDGKPSKLVPDTNNLSVGQKAYMSKLSELVEIAQKTGLSNTTWLDSVTARFALYLRKSGSV